MYKFNQDFPCSELNGATLLQACFGENELQLLFDYDIKLLIIGCYCLKSIGKILENNVETATPICRLLGKRVISAKVNSLTELEISFVDDVLYVYDDSEQFESIIFEYNKKLVVV